MSCRSGGGHSSCLQNTWLYPGGGTASDRPTCPGMLSSLQVLSTTSSARYPEGAGGQERGPFLSPPRLQWAVLSLVRTHHRLGIKLNGQVDINTSPFWCTYSHYLKQHERSAPAAATKSLQSCPTLCDPIDGSPPGSSVHGIFQARVLEWVAFVFSWEVS